VVADTAHPAGAGCPANAARATALPSGLRLTLRMPLRVKARGAFLEAIDLTTIVQAACWRLNGLATFHGGGPWPVDRAAEASGVLGRLEQQVPRFVEHLGRNPTGLRGECSARGG